MGKIFGRFLFMAIFLSAGACDQDAPEPAKGAGGQGGRALRKGEFPNVADSVYGQWRMDRDEVVDGVVYRTRMFINDRFVGVEMLCESGRVSVAAGFMVEAGLDERQKTLQVREGANRTETSADGSVTCTAVIEATQFRFELNGRRLRLEETAGDFEVFDLTRVE